MEASASRRTSGVRPVGVQPGYDFLALLREVARIDDQAVEAIADRVKESLNLEGKTVGSSVSPSSRTGRCAVRTALALAKRLLAEGARVVGFDPQAMANAKDELPELELAADAYEAAAGAHCLVVCTEWPGFRILDLEKLRSSMAYPLVVDGRNLFDRGSMAAAGFSYHPTGRPPSVVAVPSPARNDQTSTVSL
jgi:UDPglucose 6-dehydrogenase